MSYKDKLLRHYHIISYIIIKPKDWNSVKNRIMDKGDHSAEDYHIRTFQRDIKAIYDLFAVEIKYNQVLMAYEVLNREHAKQCLNALSVLVLRFGKSEKHAHVISNEDEGLGAVHLTDIMEAINNSYSLRFEYSKYSETSMSIREVIPILLKLQNRRWYLLAEDMQKEKLRVYGLDRMDNLEIKFKRVKSRFPFAECVKLWEDTLGIETGMAGQQSEIIILRVESGMAGYVKSIPWHYSQKVLSENSKYVEFEFQLIVTNDLINKIISFIQFVQIIEPFHLKEKVLKNIKQGFENNK